MRRGRHKSKKAAAHTHTPSHPPTLLVHGLLPRGPGTHERNAQHHAPPLLLGAPVGRPSGGQRAGGASAPKGPLPRPQPRPQPPCLTQGAPARASTAAAGAAAAAHHLDAAGAQLGQHRRRAVVPAPAES